PPPPHSQKIPASHFPLKTSSPHPAENARATTPKPPTWFSGSAKPHTDSPSTPNQRFTASAEANNARFPRTIHFPSPVEPDVRKSTAPPSTSISGISPSHSPATKHPPPLQNPSFKIISAVIPLL